MQERLYGIWDPEWGIPEPFETVGQIMYLEAQTYDTSAVIVASDDWGGTQGVNEPWGCVFKWVVLDLGHDPEGVTTIRELKSGTSMTPCQAAERAIGCAALHCRCSEEAFIRRVKNYRVIRALAGI